MTKRKRACITFSSSIVSILSLVLTVFFVSDKIHHWICVGAGAVLMLLAVFFHTRRNRAGYIISILLNSIGSGFSTAGVFSYYDTKANLFDVLSESIPAILFLFLIFSLIFLFKENKKWIRIISMILVICFTILSFICWFGQETLTAKNFIYFSAFLVAVYYIFVFEMSINNEKRNLLRDISYANFGTYVVVTVIAIIVISAGDVLEGIFEGIGDGIGGGGTKDGKKKK